MSTETEHQPIRAGIFKDVAGAQRAIRSLLDAGFETDQISVVCSDESKNKHFGPFHHEEDPTTTDQPQILKSGAVGVGIGALVSLGVVATGGLGVVAVGPILAGGVAGTLAGLFVGRGVENELARFYEQEVARGNILVAVDLIEIEDENRKESRLTEAERIFERCGAMPFALDEG